MMRCDLSKYVKHSRTQKTASNSFFRKKVAFFAHAAKQTKRF